MGIFVSIVNFLRKYRINDDLLYRQKFSKYSVIEVVDEFEDDIVSVLSFRFLSLLVY